MDTKRQRWTFKLEHVPTATAWLVFLLTVIAFALSYDALRNVANDNGKIGWQSYLWPLLIDFALIVFSLAVLRANLLQETAWRRWGLVGLATVATIYFNYIHAGMQVDAKIVAVVPPVALFLSFETLVGMLKSNARRKQALAPAGPDVARLEAELANLRGRLADTEQMEEKAREDANELVRKMAGTQAEFDQLRHELEKAQQQVAALQAQANALADWQLLNATAKAEWIALHTNGDRPPAAQLAAALGVAISTVSRAYKRADEARGAQ